MAISSVEEYKYIYPIFPHHFSIILLFCGWNLFKIPSLKSYWMNSFFSPHKSKAFDSIKGSTASLWVDKDLLGWLAWMRIWKTKAKLSKQLELKSSYCWIMKIVPGTLSNVSKKIVLMQNEMIVNKRNGIIKAEVKLSRHHFNIFLLPYFRLIKKYDTGFWKYLFIMFNLGIAYLDDYVCSVSNCLKVFKVISGDL